MDGNSEMQLVDAFPQQLLQKEATDTTNKATTKHRTTSASIV